MNEDVPAMKALRAIITTDIKIADDIQTWSNGPATTDEEDLGRLFAMVQALARQQMVIADLLLSAFEIKKT